MTTSTGLNTDHYELTMVQAALRSGAAHRRVVFEVFARAMPPGRRYGVVAGTERVLDAIGRFCFGPADLEFLSGVLDHDTIDLLARYSFAGDVDGYQEGDLYFPGSPVLTVEGTFAETVVLETLVLSILNHDSAVASAAARMVVAAADRPLLEMGSRRTHEEAAVAAARAAYIAGFAATSNLAAGKRYGIPTIGTSAHAFTLVHDDESSAFAAQVAALGDATTLLVDTFDVDDGVRRAVAAGGRQLGAVRLDSGDVGAGAVAARRLLDELGATATRIVASGDLDEFSLAALASAPIDSFGVGTSVVTGSGWPTVGFVYKLVEVEGRPVAKTSLGKATVGGRKVMTRQYDAGGHVLAERAVKGGPARSTDHGMQTALVRDGHAQSRPSLEEVRRFHRHARDTLAPAHLDLTDGPPAVVVTYEGAER